jgi:hypothetical protein
MKKVRLLYSIIGIFVKDPGVISAGIVRAMKIGVLGIISGVASWAFWEDGLTAVGLMLLMAVLGAAEKWLKESWGIGLAFVLALMLAQPAQAQFVIEEVSVGGGSMFGDEAMTFSWDAAFFAVHWQGITVTDAARTGLGVEIHPATVVSSFEDGVNVQAIDTVDWRLWSLNRVKMSALQIPGEVWESMYLGGDLLLAEGGGFDFTGDFSARFVYGVREGPIQLELYMFEKYRPISFAMMYRFNF